MGKRVGCMTPEQREAQRAYNRAYREAHLEEFRVLNREYYEANREVRRARNKMYREANREALKGAQRRYREATREAKKEYDQAYYADNRETRLVAAHEYWSKNRARYGEINARRRAAQLQATPFWLTPKHIAEMRKTFAFAKAICGHVDHIVPLKGKTVCGLHVPWNLQVLDPASNMSKSNREWPGMWKEAA